MDSDAAISTLSHLGISNSTQAVSAVEDGASTLLHSETGTSVVILRRGRFYDTLVVGSQTGCPVPALRSVLESAVLPLSDDYAAQIGVALPERDALRKRIREASAALDVIAKGRLVSVTPPEFPLHEIVQQHVNSGSTSADHLPDDFVNALPTLNHLQANVVAWSKEVDRIVQISREGPGAVLTAEEETVFWSSLDAALLSAQQTLASRVVKISLEILARKRRATGFLIDANNSLDGARRKATGVLTLIQGLPIVALRTAEDLPSLQVAVVNLLEHVAAKLRISSFSVERVLSLIDSMGSDVNRSVGRILSGKGGILILPFSTFVEMFGTCCELFEAWSKGFDHCRKVAREAARNKGEAMPPRRRSPLSNLYSHLTDMYELRSDHHSLRAVLVDLFPTGSSSQRVEVVDSAYAHLVDQCNSLNHFELSEAEEATWGQVSSVYRTQIVRVEDSIAAKYSEIVSRASDLRSLAASVQPFSSILEKQFMTAATSDAISNVLTLGLSELKIIRNRRQHMTSRPLRSSSEDVPLICTSLSECRLLTCRVSAIVDCIEKISGKTHMNVTPDLRDFLAEAEQLKQHLDPSQHFLEWLAKIDMCAHKSVLFSVTQNQKRCVHVVPSIDSNTIWFFRVTRYARESRDMFALLSPGHLELGRISKTLFPVVSAIKEALHCFNMVSDGLKQLDELIHTRILPLVESFWKRIQCLIEEGFTLRWDDSATKLQQYSSDLLHQCSILSGSFHIALENDFGLQSSIDSVRAISLIFSNGKVSKETSAQLQYIFKQMSVAITSFCNHFNQDDVEHYILKYCIPKLNSNVLDFFNRLSLQWVLALKSGDLGLPRVVLDTRHKIESQRTLLSFPTLLDVELLMFNSLALTIQFFVDNVICLLRNVRVHETNSAVFATSILALFMTREGPEDIVGDRSCPLDVIYFTIQGVSSRAKEWTAYVELLDIDVSQFVQLHENVDEPVQVLEFITGMLEEVTMLREGRSATLKEESRIRLDCDVLKDILLTNLRKLLTSCCDRFSLEGAECSQLVYKKISEAKAIVADITHRDGTDVLVALQSMKEGAIPFCESRLHSLYALEQKFEDVAERVKDPLFARAQFTDTWILCEGLQAHFDGLVDLYDQRYKTVLINHDTLRKKYIENKTQHQSKLASLFVDFQNIRKEGSEGESFIESEYLMQDLEHQLNTLDSQSIELECMGRALGIHQTFDSSGPKDILVELKRVRHGIELLSIVRGKLMKLSETLFQDADLSSIQTSLTEFSRETESITNSTGTKKEAHVLHSSLSKYIKDSSLLSGLFSVRLSPPRERDLLQRLFGGTNPHNRLGEIPLQHFWDSNLPEHETYIKQVLENAAGEASICEFLNGIEKSWTGRKGVFSSYDETSILQDIPYLLDEIDEHLQSLEAMNGSQYARLFESDRVSWECRLSKCREDLEMLADVQCQWAHLKTLFGVGQNGRMSGLRSELHEEFMAFSNVHARFSSLGGRLEASPGILEGLEGPLGLEDMASELQGIVRGLSRFLEKQRSRFPRFFFLSDNDLLEVLSIVPSSIEGLIPHIGKLFPGLAGFTYEKKINSVIISEVYSKEGEKLSFLEPLVVPYSELAPSWLGRIEETLKTVLKGLLPKVIEFLESKYSETFCGTISDFFDSYLMFPSQLALLATKICFARAVEKRFSQSNMPGSSFSGLLNSIQGTLLDIRSLKEGSNITSDAERRRFLLVRDHFIKEVLYQRDLLALIIQDKVRNASSYIWDQELRAYSYSDQGSFPRVVFRCAAATFEYGWEYLGVGEMLVHTNLTSRSFLTFSEALRRGYGGSPFGPAGTGKTETVKAMGRVLGRFVAVFNCDESFDSVSVGRILAGICRVGCWVCFDEFNRLSAGILSSTSGQLALLQAAIKRRLSEVKNFYGGELPISIMEGIGVFVTMNPSYSGRRELPANLKSLFRPCAMSKPDSLAIAEVMLLTQGFKCSSSLSKKLVALFENLQVTLSEQPHYDFGLRSLKSTILASGSLIASVAAESETEEEVLRKEENAIIRGIGEVLKPKLNFSDVRQYENSLSLVFTEATCLVPMLPEDIEIELRAVMSERGILQDDVLVEKMRQLYWLIQHQSGIMLVGATGSGKSAVWRTLFEALKRLANPRSNTSTKEQRVHRSSLTVIDAKLLSIQQLYGHLDPLTREWSDGIFTRTLRNLSNEYSSRLSCLSSPLHWIVFDGDVDPDWVENLNSVLDDNRILTLPSGEQVPLSANTRILFETEGLLYANPSTVSRCGMICFGHNTSMEMILSSTVEKIVKETSPTCPIPTCLPNLCKAVLEVGEAVVYGGATVMPVPLLSLTQSFFNVFRYSLEDILHRRRFSENFQTEGSKTKATTEVSKSMLLRMLMVAAVKSIGSGLNHSDRLKLSQKFVSTVGKFHEIEEALAGIVNPLDFSDVTFAVDGTFVEYRELVPCGKENLNPQVMGSQDIVIPTPTTVRLESFLRDALNLNGTHWSKISPLLLCGPPGCGKSMILTAALRDIPNLSLSTISFSSETTTENILAALKGHMTMSKRSNGAYVLHPKSTGCRVVLFCDEVNLEQPDCYQTQKSISFLRCMAEHGGFWDGISPQWIRIEGLQVVAACNPEEDAGRHKLPARFLRHCTVVRVEQPNATDLKIIYGVFVEDLLGKLHRNLPSRTKQLSSAMVEFFTRNKNKFCPVETGPLRPHYIYSPRELSRWVRGMEKLLLDDDGANFKVSSLDLDSSSDMVWGEVVSSFCYEGRRLFRDRLLTVEERTFCEKCLLDVARNVLLADSEVVMDSLYSSWISSDSNPQQRGFRIVRNPERFRNLIYQKLRVFAEEEGLGGSWMNGSGITKTGEVGAMIDQFAVTDDVLTHLTRIERSLRQPLGHIILMGAPGTGKKTLARFAAWMSSIEVHQVSSNSSYSEQDFAKDLRLVLKRAGVDGIHIAMIFDESHAMDSAFLEMMNSLLACGDVPGLFYGEDRTNLLELLRQVNVTSTSNSISEQALYSDFVKRVRNNLHIMFTMSTVSDGLDHSVDLTNTSNDDISKRSPALYNRCTVNWIGDWTRQTLEAVAELKIEVSVGREKDQIISCAVQLHEIAKLHFKEIHASVVVTPRHFLEFIEQINRIVLEKGNEIQAGVNRHTEGLRRLRHAAAAVDVLKDTLSNKAICLHESETNANEMLKNMMEEQRLAEKSKVGAEQLALAAAEASTAVLEREDEVATQLSAVLPKLDAACEAVGSIRKEFLEELRAMPNPPSGVRVALEGVMMVLDASNKKPYGQYSWGNIRGRMRGTEFITSVVNFDVQSVPQGLRSRVEKNILQNADFDVKRIAYASRAAGPLAEWTLAVLDYVAVQEAVEPLQAEVHELQEEQRGLLEGERSALGEVAVFQSRIEQCRTEYAKLVSEAERVRQEIQEAEKNLSRAEEMLDSLADEWDRWIKELNAFNSAAVTVWGNGVYAAAFVAYAGPLDHRNRSDLILKWKNTLQSEGIPFQDDLELSEFLTSSKEKGLWSTRGLPIDSTSLENYAILKRSARFPLLVDPTRCSCELLRKVLEEPSDNIASEDITGVRKKGFRMTETSFASSGKKSFMRALESSMRFGTTIVVEDAEKFDRAVTPLLGQESSYGDSAKYVESLSGASTKNLDRNANKGICQRVVRLGDKDVFLSPSFRMFLTTVHIKSVPRTAVTRANVVSFELSSAALQSTCISWSMKLLAPELEEKRKNSIAAKVRYQERKHALEEKVLSTVNNVDDLGGELLRGSLLDNLSSLKEEVRFIEEKQNEEQVASLEIKRGESQFMPLGKAAVDVFEVVQGLSSLDPIYSFNTSFFLRIFENALKSCAQRVKSLSGYCAVLECQKSLLKRTYLDIVASLYPMDKLPFAAALSLVIDGRGENAGVEKEHTENVQNVLHVLRKSLTLERASDCHESPGGVLSFLSTYQKGLFQKQDEEDGDDSKSQCLSAALHILRCILYERHRISEAIDGLACTLPEGKDLIHNKDIGPDAALRSALSKYSINESGSEAKRNLYRPILLCAKGENSDPVSLVTELTGQLHISVISLAMGSSVTAGSLSDALSLATKKIEKEHKTVVLLKNMHLANKPTMERLQFEVAKRNGQFSFLLIVAAEMSLQLCTPYLMGISGLFRVLAFEAPPTFRSNLRLTFERVSTLRSLSNPTPEDCNMLLDRMEILVSWLHSCLIERALYSPLGFTKTYEFSEGDLSAAWDVVISELPNITRSKDHNVNLAHLLTTAVYGCRLERETDQDIMKALVVNIFCHKPPDDLAGGMVSVVESTSRTSGIAIPIERSKRHRFIEELPLHANPEWCHMPSHTSISQQTLKGFLSLDKMISLSSKNPCEILTEDGKHASRITDLSLDSIVKKGQDIPDVLFPTQAQGDSSTPLNRFWEIERTNISKIATIVRQDIQTLCGERKLSRKEVTRSAALKMDILLICSEGSDGLPSMWKKLCLANDDKMSIVHFFSKLSESIKYLNKQTCHGRHINISYVGRPNALFSAIRFEEAASCRVAPHILQPIFVVRDKDDTEGWSVSGLQLDGASWDENRNVFVLSESQCPLIETFSLKWVESDSCSEKAKTADHNGITTMSLPLYNREPSRDEICTIQIPVDNDSSLQEWRLRSVSFSRR